MENRTVGDFRDCIQRCGLLDMKFVGSPFTRSNEQFGWRRVSERLNRVLVSPDWLNAHPRSIVIHDARIASDHCPLLLDSDGASRGGP